LSLQWNTLKIERVLCAGVMQVLSRWSDRGQRRPASANCCSDKGHRPYTRGVPPIRGCASVLPATQAASRPAACAMGPIFCGRPATRGGRVLPGGAFPPYKAIGLLKKKFPQNLANFRITHIGRQRRLQLCTSQKDTNRGQLWSLQGGAWRIAAAPNLIQFERRPAMLSSSRSLSLLDLRVLGKLRAALLSDKVTATEPFTRATCLQQRRRTERHGISHQCHEDLKPDECEFTHD
jgi:hypothetical protein